MSIVKTLTETIDPEYDTKKTKLSKFSPEELLGLTFLHDTADQQCVCAEIVKRIHDLDSENTKTSKLWLNMVNLNMKR